MEYLEGNLINLALDGEVDVLIHGCNCYCRMGIGFALQVKNTFREAYMADLDTVSGDISKLGRFSSAVIIRPTAKFILINAYTQYRYGAPDSQTKNADYHAIANVFESISKRFKKDQRIRYPKIGAGYAGGDWNIISNIIDSKLKGFDHKCVILK